MKCSDVIHAHLSVDFVVIIVYCCFVVVLVYESCAVVVVIVIVTFVYGTRQWFHHNLQTLTGFLLWWILMHACVRVCVCVCTWYSPLCAFVGICYWYFLSTLCIAAGSVLQAAWNSFWSLMQNCLMLFMAHGFIMDEFVWCHNEEGSLSNAEHL